MKNVNTKGLMLGMLAIGGLIAGGAMFTTGPAYAQVSQSATVGQANVNEDNDIQVAESTACQAVALAGANVCANEISAEVLDDLLGDIVLP